MADRMPVGQVWIRVSPDTRGFARETKNKLQRMKSLDRYKVPIEVEVDIEKIQDDFDKAIKKLQDTADKAKHRVRIKTEMEWHRGDAQRQMRKQLDEYQDLADKHRVNIKTDLDNDYSGDPASTPVVNLSVNERQFERDVKRLMEQTKADLKVGVDKKTLRDEMRETADEVGAFLGRLMDRDKNKLQIQVETKSLHDAEMRLAELQKHYDGAAEAAAATGRELSRVTREYNNISRRLGQMRWDLADINTETKEGAEEYRLLASRMVALNKQLRMFGDERKRLMDFGRKNWLEIETNVESMRRAEEEVENLRERVNEIASEIEVGLDRTSVAAVSAELLTLVRPRIVSIYTRIVNHRGWKKFWADADASAARLNANLTKYATQIIGLRLLYKTVEDLVQVVPKLDMMIPSLAAGSVAAVAAISAASGLLGSILTIGADMLRVFNLVLALPSVLAGLVGSVLILGRAFKDFETRLPEIVSYWERLGDTVSDRVWDRAEVNVRKLHRALVPLLDAHVPDWADAWGDSLGALADGLRRAVETGHLEEFLENSIKGTKAAEDGWDSLGAALLRMIGIGSRFFPQLGTWFSETMQSFEDWVRKSDENGNFERWIEDGIRAFNDLGRVIRATGSILRSLAIASRAAGLPTLTEFADGMTALADKMRTPGFQHALTGPLENMVGLLEEVGTLAPLIEKALGRVWELAGQAALELKGPLTGALEGILTQFTSGQFQQDITSFFESIGSFIEDITPGLESLVREFGSMAAVVGVAAKSWGPAFNEMLLLFEDLGKGMRPGLESFLENTGPKLEELVKDLRPEVERLGDAIGDLLGNKSFQSFVGYMIDALGNILTLAIRVGIALLDAFRGFAEWWDNQPEWFKTLSTHLLALAFALPLVAAGFGAVMRVLKPLVTLFGVLRGAIGLVGAALRGLGARLLAWGAGRGLAGIVARVLGRSLLIGGGPVGWALLIASFVPYDLPLTLANGVIQALFPDTWFAYFADKVTAEVRKQIGGKTIFDIIWDGIKGLFREDATFWERVESAIMIIFPPYALAKAIAQGIIKALIGDNGDNPAWHAVMMAISFRILHWMNLLIHGPMGIITSIQNAWNTIKAAIDNWEPSNPLGSAAKWLYEKIVKPIVDWLLGGGGEEEIESSLGANSAFSTGLADGIKKSLDGTWRKLRRTFTDWEPDEPRGQVGFDSGGIVDWVKKHFIGEDPATELDNEMQSTFDTITPRLQTSFWSGLDRLRAALGPLKNSQGDGVMTSHLGLGPDEISKIAQRAGAIQATTGTLSSGVQGSLRGMGEGAGGTVRQLVTFVQERFGVMSEGAQQKAREMDAGASEEFRSMSNTGLFEMDNLKSGSTSKAGAMETGVLGHISAMRSRGILQMAQMQGGVTARATTMQTAVLARMTTMATRSGTQMVQMQRSILASLISLQTGAASRAGAMASQFVAQMTGMASRSRGIASTLRGGLIRLLTINLSGAGRTVGSTFTSGLSGGLSRARGVASTIAGGIRSILSFSAYGSGASIGSTFASGIRSRIGTVRSAAATLAATVRNRLPNSPAAEGPFSGSGWGGWGESIADELANGLRRGAPEVAREATRMMESVNSALDTRSDGSLAVDLRRSRALSALPSAGEGARAGDTYQITVESRSDEPLQEGARFAGDIAFYMRGKKP